MSHFYFICVWKRGLEIKKKTYCSFNQLSLLQSYDCYNPVISGPEHFLKEVGKEANEFWHTVIS